MAGAKNLAKKKSVRRSERYINSINDTFARFSPQKRLLGWWPAKFLC
jgi:hypothetical protein